jgi:hypothetical protein
MPSGQIGSPASTTRLSCPFSRASALCHHVPIALAQPGLRLPDNGAHRFRHGVDGSQLVPSDASGEAVGVCGFDQEGAGEAGQGSDGEAVGIARRGVNVAATMRNPHRPHTTRPDSSAEPDPGNVKLLLPPRQSRGNSQWISASAQGMRRRWCQSCAWRSEPETISRCRRSGRWPAQH